MGFMDNDYMIETIAHPEIEFENFNGRGRVSAPQRSETDYRARCANLRRMYSYYRKQLSVTKDRREALRIRRQLQRIEIQINKYCVVKKPPPPPTPIKPLSAPFTNLYKSAYALWERGGRRNRRLWSFMRSLKGLSKEYRDLL